MSFRRDSGAAKPSLTYRSRRTLLQTARPFPRGRRSAGDRHASTRKPKPQLSSSSSDVAVNITVRGKPESSVRTVWAAGSRQHARVLARSTLPSVANLKARFARFGPLEVDSTRVFWKSHSCRVQFKYKSDALKALGYVKSNDIFGQIQVDYSVREVEAPAPEPQPAAGEYIEVENATPQVQGRLKSISRAQAMSGGRESQRV
ncbi:uncharacterized protein A4U43_C02F20930 [Asparagus officinalis]|uniref:Uncharacterized protein n=1 Tax=Asparagus officinalis TaxID=4686 RepID=A0A5P1FPL9_ASPOF|nr:uncharacterized protein A4U43_C02F20930 [Asparagus officinalis]